jgi:GNAT superfamily N-acetyltransferase
VTRRVDPDVRLARITELPADFADLVTLSLREDFGAMQRMRENWDSGANRFDRPGEVVYEARVGPRLVGVCGLNRDPYTTSPGIGRVRHLYVDPEFRRRGVGRSLVSTIVECARPHFSRVRLRTLRDDAARFYLALGFRSVEGEPEVTHDLLT